MIDEEIMYANPLEWKLMVAKNTGNTKVTYDELNGLVETINRQQAEIERLKAGVNVELENYASEYDSKIKAEAIKEFAKRLKKEVDFVDTTRKLKKTIDNLVKEMAGEDK